MIDRIYSGCIYTITHDGMIMQDQDAPIPPTEVVNKWRREAAEDFDREIVNEARRMLAKERQTK